MLGQGFPQDGHCLSSPERVLRHVARLGKDPDLRCGFLLIAFLTRVVRSHPGP